MTATQTVRIQPARLDLTGRPADLGAGWAVNIVWPALITPPVAGSITTSLALRGVPVAGVTIVPTVTGQTVKLQASATLKPESYVWSIGWSGRTWIAGSLTVTNDPAAPTEDNFDLLLDSTTVSVSANIGATGPQGPAGSTGPTGPAGPQGPAGTNGGGYPHIQGVALSTWPIPHNLGYKPGGFLVTDSSGANIAGGEIVHIDNNNSTITFASSFSGKAYVS
jgi:hypothetical protein